VGAGYYYYCFNSNSNHSSFLYQWKCAKKRNALEKTLFIDKRTSYEPGLKVEIMQTEAYRNFKKTKVMDSLHIYLQQAEMEGKARLKSKDSTP
jgi:hypothetical protein